MLNRHIINVSLLPKICTSKISSKDLEGRQGQNDWKGANVNPRMNFNDLFIEHVSMDLENLSNIYTNQIDLIIVRAGLICH